MKCTIQPGIDLLAKMLLLIGFVSCTPPVKHDKANHSTPKFLNSIAPAHLPATESPPVFKASRLLPRRLLSDPNYSIEETVRNDGLLNHYQVTSAFGSLDIFSTDRLIVRLGELRALSLIRSLESSGPYIKAVKKTREGRFKFIRGLFVEAGDSLPSNISHRGIFPNNVGHSIFGSLFGPDDTNYESLAGFSGVKNIFAFELGVDPYSDNTLLQRKLNKLSWVSVAGGLTLSDALQVIPKKLAASTSETKFIDAMRQIVRDNSPAQLKIINAQKIKKMFVRREIASDFLNSPHYSPSRKTFVTGALDGLVNTVDREKFLQVAALAQTDSGAFYHQRQAEMMLAYHQNVSPVERIFLIGGAPFLLNRQGVVVAVFPLDHIAWTKEVSAMLDGSAEATIQSYSDVKGMELRFAATVSRLARQVLETRGWNIIERVSSRLSES